MSLSASLNAATSGLALEARRAELIATNVARADDQTYVKRRLETDGTAPGTVVSRIVDPAAQQMRREAQAEAAGAAVGQAFAARLDQLVGDPDQPGSLQDAIARFSAALTVAAADPTSEPSLSTAVDALGEVADRLNLMADAVTTARQDAELAIAAAVERLNGDLRAIEDINARIVRAAAIGQDASALRDRRAMHIDAVSELVPVRRLDRGDGTLGLVTLGGAILLDGEAATVGFDERQAITPDQTYPATLSGLTLRGQPVGTGRVGEGFAGGALAGYFTVRDEGAPRAMERLDAVAFELAARLQEADGTIGPSDAGALTDGGARVAVSPSPGLAWRIAVNADLADASSRRLRDGMAGAADPTSNDQLLRFSAALEARDAPRAGALGSAETDVAGLAGKLRSMLSSDRVAWDRTLDRAGAEADRLIAERDGGAISIDEEMQRLLRVEQAYAANARLIQVVSQMMDQVTEI